MHGTTIAHYKITAKLGQGGMGEVYRATDTKLDREVAIKVLPESVAQDKERLARFEREARMLAQLNHPNIAGVYGLEQSGDTQALILELVEGDDLSVRLKRGPLPVDEALEVCKQIAEALEAAHEKGIIHRDLKPGNIKLTEDGKVKVLDFGLAKALADESDSSSISSAEDSPTITDAFTKPGTILGTAAYMSPEQARGKPVDKRTDIWAFGCVLYECLTGKILFKGEEVTETLARIIEREPDWTSLSENTPPTILLLLRKSLTKDRRRRLHDIADARVDLEQAIADPSSSFIQLTDRALQARMKSQENQKFIWIRNSIILCLLTAALVWFLKLESFIPSQHLGLKPVRASIVLPENAPLRSSHNATLGISPDGAQVVYTSSDATGSESQLYLRRLDQFSSERLRGGDGDQPFISPDGEWVGFVSRSKVIRKVPITGGLAVTIGESANLVRGATWGPNDLIVFGTVNKGLYGVSAQSGEPEVLTTPNAANGEISHRWPFRVPGDSLVLFNITTEKFGTRAVDAGELAMLDLVTGEVSHLGLAGVNPRYVSTGHIVYAGEENSVLAVPFDIKSRQITADPAPVVEGVRVTPTGAAYFSISDDGRFVFVPEIPELGRSLVWVERDGSMKPIDGLPLANYLSVNISPDGTALALSVYSTTRPGLRVFDLERQTLNIIAGADITGLAMANPIWDRNGFQVVFSMVRNRAWGLYRRNADGTGESEELITSTEATRLVALSWSTDTQTLVAMKSLLNSRENRLIFSDQGIEIESPIDAALDASVSPNGDWIAYTLRQSGQSQVYIERFPKLGDRRLVSIEGGQQPRWSRDGSELYYLDGEAHRLMVVDITKKDDLQMGRPEKLAEGSFLSLTLGHSYDVAPDGRFAMIMLDADDSERKMTEFNIVLNWFEDLKQLKSVKGK